METAFETDTDHLAGLTDAQREAVEHREGPALVIAGPGSGKTRVITRRIAHLLKSGVRASRILALTFTNKAAGEMRERVEQLVPEAKVVMGTFHSFASRTLRRYCQELNLDKNFGVCDEADRSQLIRECMTALGLQTKDGSLGEVSDAISRAKNSLVPAGRHHLDLPEHSAINAMVHRRYQWALRRSGRLDFDDLLNLLADALRQNERLRAKLDDQFRYILVDECVPSWTPVMMGDGSSKEIKDIVVGDIVRSYDTAIGVAKNCRVTATQKIPNAKPLVRIKVRHCHRTGTNRKTNFVVCTTDHKVWTTNRGWVEAGKLIAGDEVIVETDAVKSKRGKIAAAGRDKLSKLHMGNRKFTTRVVAPRSADQFNSVKGGNGRGLTKSQAALLECLGDGWCPEHVVPTRERGHGVPTHYKIDVACPEFKIAIEIDGQSHRKEDVKQADVKKEQFLQQSGWTVHRYSNRDIAKNMPAILQAVCPDGSKCPKPAKVIAVDPTYITEHHVYDISVEDTHCFYANGILVHNCQDTNPVQYLLLRLLTRDVDNVMAVGDPDQSIYKFRNADIRNILAFQQDYRNCKVVKLEHNYRSTPEILRAADQLIRNNRERIEKVLIPTRGDGARVEVYGHQTEQCESKAIAEDIQRSVEFGRKYADHAVLVRVHRLVRGKLGIEQALLRRGIPYKVYGGLGFLGRQEVKDILAYCRLATCPMDRLSFSRVVNEPNRGVGKLTLAKLLDWAADNELPPLAACRVAGRIDGIRGKTLDSLAEFVRVVDRLATLTDRPGELVREAALATGYRQSIADKQTEEAAERVAIVDQLIDLGQRYADDNPTGTMAEFLEQITLGESDESGEEEDEEQDRVAIMTLHGAKGLEFPVVYLPGLEMGILPGQQAISAGFSGDPAEIEEERRTFFVGMTRAMDRLVISLAKFRMTGDKFAFSPHSQFLDELPMREMQVRWYT